MRSMPGKLEQSSQAGCWVPTCLSSLPFQLRRSSADQQHRPRAKACPRFRIALSPQPGVGRVGNVRTVAPTAAGMWEEAIHNSSQLSPIRTAPVQPTESGISIGKREKKSTRDLCAQSGPVGLLPSSSPRSFQRTRRQRTTTRRYLSFRRPVYAGFLGVGAAAVVGRRRELSSLPVLVNGWSTTSQEETNRPENSAFTTLASSIAGNDRLPRFSARDHLTWPPSSRPPAPGRGVQVVVDELKKSRVLGFPRTEAEIRSAILGLCRSTRQSL
ncbi:hypothetical protein QBC39DRAFT_38227 [Podospora conica]|nr:hypothetical protein QBC39DRAFT_38227 [Schizothecium conicum]